MSNKRFQIRTLLLLLASGFAAGYLSRYIGLPLPQIPDAIGERTSTIPYVPSHRPIGKSIDSAIPAVILPRSSATPPEFVVLDVDERGTVAGVSMIYTDPGPDFALKDEVVRLYGSYELSATADRSDFGLFRDESRRVVWAAHFQGADNNQAAIISAKRFGVTGDYFVPELKSQNRTSE